MAWWQWLVGILMFILALSVLIGIHELGHLGAAKMFHVYCFNYSIGFGPKLLSTKRNEKHETEWSLRAIPLGGFVAMYGEGVDMQGVSYIPPSRSLEGVARYKRAIIVSAGVFLNFILGFVLILLHNGCFDHIFIYRYAAPSDNYASMLVTTSKDVPNVNNFDGLKMNADPLTGLYVLDNEVINSNIPNEKYVLVTDGSISTIKEDPSINFILYGTNNGESVDINIDKSIAKGYSKETLISLIVLNENIDTKDKTKYDALLARVNQLYKEGKNNDEYKEQMKTYYQKSDIKYSINTDVKYTVNSSAQSFNIDLKFYRYNTISKKHESAIKTVPFVLQPNEKKNGWADIGVHMKRTIERYDAEKTFKTTWNEWCNANATIFKALGQIFTGNIKNVGGIIAIANQSSVVLSNFGFERYLYMWGMISCNLAIINLLPIPGLDGWSLLVTAYEGVTKKQIPTKVKAIVSLIGLVFVFSLMVLIIIKDIITLI